MSLPKYKPPPSRDEFSTLKSAQELYEDTKNKALNKVAKAINKAHENNDTEVRSHLDEFSLDVVENVIKRLREKGYVVELNRVLTETHIDISW